MEKHINTEFGVRINIKRVWKISELTERELQDLVRLLQSAISPNGVDGIEGFYIDRSTCQNRLVASVEIPNGTQYNDSLEYVIEIDTVNEIIYI